MKAGTTLNNPTRFREYHDLPLTYFRRWGFSINEGGGPVNLHMQWFRPWCWLFIYLYAFGKSFSFVIKRKQKEETAMDRLRAYVGEDDA